MILCVVHVFFFDMPTMCLRIYVAAQALQLPFVPPSLPEKDRGQFPHGANFAVLASTALPPEYFRRRNHTVPMPFSLATQLEWFKQTLQRIAPGDGK